MILEAKVRKPRSELNPGVWQGDCFAGIDQNRSKMFRRPGLQMPVLCRADSHSPEDRAEIPQPGDWRSTLFRCGAQPPSAIALTRRDADCSVWVGIAWSSRDAAGDRTCVW